MYLKKEIMDAGIENCLFIVNMRPVRTVLGLVSYTSSNDDYVKVPAKITEKRYKIKDGYKIELKSIYPTFGSESFYLSDLEHIISNGYAEMYVKKK